MLLALAVGAVLIIGAPTIAQAGAPFQICNKTRHRLNLAIAWWSRQGGFISMGWWDLKQGECVQVFDDDSADAHRLYYAEEVDGNSTWSGDTRACVSQEKFRYENYSQPSCPQGWKQKGFLYFGDKNLDLTED